VTAPRRPRLASRARLHFDRHDGTWLLVYPERALVLNPTAHAVVALLTGEHTAEGIAASLATAHPGMAADAVVRDVHAFLDRLAARNLLEDGARRRGRGRSSRS
jgi:pyrroloquinoline quinone biosynthesis protein D